MAKRRKIKRYNHKSGSGASGLRLFVVGCALIIFAGLMIFIGVSIYQPVYDFIMNIGKESSTELPQPPEFHPDEESAPPEEPEPEPTFSQQAGTLRIAFLPFSTAQSSGELDLFLNALEATDVNAVMLDVKDSQGRLLYRTKHPQALEWGAQSETALDLQELRQKLDARGLYLVARMATFSDPIGARGDRERNAIHYQNSDMLWLDNAADMGGKPWLNPYAPESRAYLSGIAAELVDLGAVMVVLDGVRFPDDSGGYATYGPASDGVSRLAALQSFVSEVEAVVREQGARLAVYLPSTALTQQQSENRYGSDNPLQITQGGDILLGLLPYQYENGYSSQGLELSKPTENPAATVATLLSYAIASKGAAAQSVIPLLQGGNEADLPAYTAEQFAAQIAAVLSAGCSEYALYATTGSYLFP